jgi:hypothetical protein
MHTNAQTASPVGINSIKYAVMVDVLWYYTGGQSQQKWFQELKKTDFWDTKEITVTFVRCGFLAPRAIKRSRDESGRSKASSASAIKPGTISASRLLRIETYSRISDLDKPNLGTSRHLDLSR